MSLSIFSLPSAERYFEDYVAGSIYEYGPASVDASEAYRFIKQFGPGFSQAGEKMSPNREPGSTVANEWHVMGIMMRLFVEGFLPSRASIASPGVDDIHWLKSVRAGDSLRIRITIVEARLSQSKPDRGFVRVLMETFNQYGELVLSLKSMNLIRCRTDGDAHPRS